MLPKIELTGNLVADPELRFTPAGHAVAKMRVACNDRKRQPDGSWVDGDACFLDLTVWKAKAEAAAERFTKGSKVMVVGRLTQRSFDTAAGERRTVYEVQVDEIGELVTMSKAVKSAAPGSAEDPWAGSWSQPSTDEAPF